MFRLQAVSEDDTIYLNLGICLRIVTCRPCAGNTGAVFVLLVKSYINFNLFSNVLKIFTMWSINMQC